MKIDMPGNIFNTYIPSTNNQYGSSGSPSSSNSGYVGSFVDSNIASSPDAKPEIVSPEELLKNPPENILANSGYTTNNNNYVYNYDPNLTSGYQSFLESLTNYFTGNSDWERTQLQNKFNADEAQKNREFNALEAQKNRDYQTAMSNSAYQRAFADMRSAGLNPYLAYNQGGAMTPSGATASGTSAYATSYKADKDGFNSLANIMSALVKNSTSANYLATSVMKLFGK